MLEGREWATDLTQKEFNDIFPEKYPQMDVVPDVKNWTKGVINKGTGIDSFSPEELTIDNAEQPHADVKETKKSGDKVSRNDHLTAIYQCQFCPRKIKGRLGITNHEKKCKLGLNKPLLKAHKPVEEKNYGKANISRSNK